MLIRLVISDDEKDKQGMAQNGCSTLSLCPLQSRKGGALQPWNIAYTINSQQTEPKVCKNHQ